MSRKEHLKDNNQVKMKNIDNDTNQYDINDEVINIKNSKLSSDIDDIDDIEELTKNKNIIKSTELNKASKHVSKFFNYENDNLMNPFKKDTDNELADNNIIFDNDNYNDDDPFAKTNGFNEINITAISKIEIWVEIKKGKKNTYVYDLEQYMDIETMKAHLKKIKIAKGCNGSITVLRRDTGDIQVLQLQGNHKDYMGKYLIHVGIDKDLIYIKGE